MDNEEGDDTELVINFDCPLLGVRCLDR